MWTAPRQNNIRGSVKKWWPKAKAKVFLNFNHGASSSSVKKYISSALSFKGWCGMTSWRIVRKGGPFQKNFFLSQKILYERVLVMICLKKKIYIYIMCIALYANTTCSSGSQPVHRFAKPLWGNRRVLIPVAGFHQRLLQELPRKSGDILMDKPSRPQAAQGSELQHGQSDTGVSTELRRNKKPPN